MTNEPETKDPRIEPETSEELEVTEAEAEAEVQTADNEAEAQQAAEDETEAQQAAEDEAEAQQAAGEQEEAPKKRGKLGAPMIVAIVAALGLIGAIIYALLTGHGSYAMKISETEYSLGEANFAYMSVFQQVYSQYAMYDPNVLPDDPYTMGDGELDTWGDYYMDQTKTQLQQITVLYERALKDGIKLDKEDTDEIDSYIQEMKDNASQTGEEDFDAFLNENFGEGVTEAVVRSMYERQMLAMKYFQNYQDNLEFTDDEIEAAYEKDKDSYDTFHFVICTVEAEADDSGMPTDDAMAAAKEKAEAMLEKVQDGDGEAIDRMKAAAENEDDVQSYDMDGSEVASNQIPFESWLKDADRKAGDTTVSEMQGYGYFVVLFEGRERDDEPTVNVRHILIQAEDADGDGEISDAEYEVAKAQIEEIRSQWETGDKTEDSFAALAEEYSADPGSVDNGGLYENVYNGQMVDTFNDFCFDPDRKAGDVGIVQNTVHGGYHLIYFVGTGEPHSNLVVRDALVSEAMTTLVDELNDNLPEVVEGKDFEKIALPASVLEQLQSAKDAYNNNDTSLPAESDTGDAEDELQEVAPEEDLADAPAEEAEDAAQESAAP